MRVEFSGQTQCCCMVCDRIRADCHFFRIHEDPGQPPLYRTLYSFKGTMCQGCRSHGEDFVESRVHELMKEYIGRQL